jgi:hypothetical protein
MKAAESTPGSNEVKTLEEAEERFQRNKSRLRTRSEAAALALETNLQELVSSRAELPKGKGQRSRDR